LISDPVGQLIETIAKDKADALAQLKAWAKTPIWTWCGKKGHVHGDFSKQLTIKEIQYCLKL